MSLQLDTILVTGRTFEEYIAFFDLTDEELQGKKVLDCPGGASSFGATARSKGIEALSTDIIYQFKIEDICQNGEKTIAKIYEDVSWMEGFNFDFYGSIDRHRAHREKALQAFCEDYDPQYYHFNTLPHLAYDDRSFDILLSSHLLFVYDDRFDYAFHKASVFEMLRIAKEVRIFPLVDYKNSRENEAENFSPHLYRLINDLEGYECEIVKVGFEFQPRAGYMLKIKVH